MKDRYILEDIGDQAMNERHDNGPDMVDVTDSLEAVSVFRAWKNLFLLVLILGMFLIQGVFWVTNLGLLPSEGQADPNTVADIQTVIADSNASLAAEQPVSTDASALYGMTALHLERGLWLVNRLVFLAAVLYCLTLMFSMMVTIISRLGGIRHICRAFFLSMIILTFMVPWHAILDNSVLGVLFNYQDILQAMTSKQESLYTTIMYYARFCGYWGLVMLMLIATQARLGRWKRSMQRRLEII